MKAKMSAEGKDLSDSKLDAPLVLSNYAEFLDEKGALQELVESRGHILILSPKCHPEWPAAVSSILGIRANSISEGIQMNDSSKVTF